MGRFALTALVAIAMQQSAPAIEISMQARSVRPGEVAVLSIAPPGREEPVRVRAFGRSIPVYRDGGAWRAIVGIDLATKPAKYVVGVSAGALTASYDLDVAPRTFPTRRLTVDEAFVTPPASALPRIQRDAALLARTWQSSAATREWTSAFVRPVQDPANSAFGTRSIFNGEPRSPHGGADFLSPAGTPILSPNAGRVAVAEDLYYTGNTVVVDHGLGVFSLLAHRSKIDVKAGDQVSAGQRLGLVGATGRVTGPHLHWTVRINDARVDPLSLLDVLGR